MSTPRLRRALFIALLALFFVASAALLRFTVSGSFNLILPMHSPVNAESIVALSFVLLVFLRIRTRITQPALETTHSALTPIAGIGVIAVLPFLITINAPLLYDSYTHIAKASAETWPQILTVFIRPSARDLFFRPLGYLSYWLDFKWAGYDPVHWHLWNLALHVANTCLVYALATELSLNRSSAAVAALVFGIHVSRPEVVSWAAARFDLLAAFFVLLSLVALNRYLRTMQSRWYALMLSSALLAVLSKESAYCLPFIAFGLLPFTPRTSRKRLLRASAALLALCAAVFLYRCWIIGGIGGYRTASGASAVLAFNPILTIKALFFRQWAFLFFPINWSAGINVWLKGSVLLMLLAMLGFLICSNTRKTLLAAALLLVILADLPVQHLLLLTADLAGARVLYLPVLGLALFWGLLSQECSPSPLRIPLVAALLLFQFVALAHNLVIWRRVAFLSQQTCRAIGTELARDPRPILVRNLPRTWNGVYFLRNGFPECVAINSGQPANRIHIENEEPPSDHPRIFSWNNLTERLEEAISSDR